MSQAVLGEGVISLERLSDQRKKVIPVEIRDIESSSKIIGELSVEALWIHSRKELCQRIIADLEKEKQALDLAIEEKKESLAKLQQPFKPLQGFEIASRVAGDRDLKEEPITFLEDPFNGTPCSTAMQQFGYGPFGHQVKNMLIVNLAAFAFGMLASVSKNTLCSVTPG